MTTDITNVQWAYMMCTRMAVRAPLNLIFSLVMCLIICPHIAPTFAIAAVFLVAVLGSIMVVTIRIFNKMFDGYDDLNASVQENVSAIRVVKAFVREGYEDKKFSKASTRLYKLAVKAESLLAFNNPAMMLSVYFCIIMVSWMGAELIVGGSLTTGRPHQPLQLHHEPADEPDDALHAGGHDHHVPRQRAPYQRGPAREAGPARPGRPRLRGPNGSIDFDNVNSPISTAAAKHAI